MSRFRILSLISISLLVVASCTTPVNYNPSYQGRINPIPGPQLDGRAVVFTSVTNDNYVYEGNPTSFTGGGSSIQIPLGLITKQIATNVFERMFENGVIQTSDLDSVQNYTVAITPTLSTFTYAYNQLQNAGMLVTPQVNVSIAVDLRKSDGSALRSMEYSSGIRDGDSYFMATNPAERINQLAHEVITELLYQAASDVYYLISNENS